MSIRKITKLLLPFTLILFSLSILAQIPSRPTPPRLVNDFTGILSKAQISNLEAKLVRFNDTTSNQITVVIVKSLNGQDKAMFAYEIGEKWKVGQKKFDNGIVVLVKPKFNARDKGQAFVAVGYGLEPAIPDAIAKRIVENEMIPEFKNGNYYYGINNATNVLMQFAAGEINADDYNRSSNAKGIFALLPFLIIFLVIFLIRVSNRSRSIGAHGSGSLWTALFLGSMLGNNSHSGSWNNFSGGGSGFGGGGSFGGFGGGSFGGGGAGGSW